MISHCETGLSDLGCRVQSALSGHYHCRRSQGGMGSSEPGTSYQLISQDYPTDTEMAKMNPPHNRNLSIVVCQFYNNTEELCLFVYSLSCINLKVFYYLLGTCYMWTVQTTAEKCQSYRWLVQHYHVGTRGQVGTHILWHSYTKFKLSFSVTLFI